MPVAAIALGSNLPSAWGSPEDALREAVRRVGELGRVTAVSSFYRTAPVGYTEQPDFVNAALLLETGLAPLDVMRGLLGIERAMGRERGSAVAKGPRVIDLDLLLLGDAVLDLAATADSPALTLPHPEMAGRRFVLVPLAEIAPAMRDPRSGCSMVQLLGQLTGG